MRRGRERVGERREREENAGERTGRGTGIESFSAMLTHLKQRAPLCYLLFSETQEY